MSRQDADNGNHMMTWRHLACLLLTAVSVAAPGIARAAPGQFRYVHLLANNAEEGAKWYIKYMGCQPVPERIDACAFGSVQLVFSARLPMGGSPGTGLEAIGISVPNLDAKIKEFRAAGSGGTGVRILTPVQDEPGLYKSVLVADTWSTRTEVVEDPENLGLHHVRLKVTDPSAALKWYQEVFGGKAASLKGRLNGVLFDKTWLLLFQAEGRPAPTSGRSINALGFSFADLDAATADMKKKGIQIQSEPQGTTGGPASKTGFIVSPDGVRIELVQP